ncbi:MAG: 50S ribosomal protein L5 [candidate division TM6 bacterium GW2011_GWE2_41_16]|nr:MAG: 50S ribosomal protein L5 [candidate division TM6 bacterium GW2011_GWE2_41_16]
MEKKQKTPVAKKTKVVAKTTSVASLEKLRMITFYRDTLRGQLKDQLGLKNVMQVPRLEKIVLNVGVKEAVGDNKILTLISDVLTAISGQQSRKTAARKSIAGFKIRTGMKIGSCVTLRGDRMYAFFDKLVNIGLPKVRDFQGVSVKLDGRGNYNLGIKEWSIFPEAEAIAGDKSYGLNITIQTSALNDEHARALLKGLGMPFRK